LPGWHREQIGSRLEQGLSVTTMHVLLQRRGVVVPYRTLHRFAVVEPGFGRRRAMMRICRRPPECLGGAEGASDGQRGEQPGVTEIRIPGQTLNNDGSPSARSGPTMGRRLSLVRRSKA
jgi:hypothetical protein